MLLKLPYGSRELSLEYPDGRIKKILEARPLPAQEPEEKLVREALAHPIDSAPLPELVKKGETACVICGDMTRLWARYHVLLPPVLDALNSGGIPDRNIFLVSATGDHREQTPDEHRRLAGDAVCRRVKIYDHRARDDDELVYLGTTAYGTPVKINRRVVEADRVILTGGIVYHFLAGWGGGKKAIIPGVAGYETIMKNHSLAFLPAPGAGLNPSVCAGNIDHNPCSDDMVQGASLVGPDFLVNSIINEETGKIARVVAGSYLTAHRQGCSFVDRHFGVNIDGKAELVIASCGGYPKDINLYQSYKAIYNAHFALQKGGTLILLSESREGMGNDDFTAMFNDYPDNPGREKALRERYTIGGHMAYHTSVIAEENDVLVVSSLPAGEIKATGMIPLPSLEACLDFVMKKHGGLPEAYIMPHGGSTLPKLAAGG